MARFSEEVTVVVKKDVQAQGACRDRVNMPQGKETLTDLLLKVKRRLEQGGNHGKFGQNRRTKRS